MSKRALLSVSDKTGLEDFGRGLVALGFELVASGGTARRLQAAGLPVQSVEAVTQAPEMLGGRVKTLHPAIHGGILARRTEDHLGELAAHGVAPIDVVVCNLYPFEETVAGGDVEDLQAIEQIDIGGVTLLRAAAKNFESVTVLCDPADYGMTLEVLGDDGGDLGWRRRLALKAFRHTASYDTAIATWLGHGDPSEHGRLLEELHLSAERVEALRYGENPHQDGALYQWRGQRVPYRSLQGKALSYNNIADLDAAWTAAASLETPTVAIIKHANPCGLATDDDLLEAYRLALASDPVSAFGSIIAVNRVVEMDFVDALGKLFVEALVAPDFGEGVLEALAARKKNCRVIRIEEDPGAGLVLRSVRGGLLVQTPDTVKDDERQWKVVSDRQPTEAEWTSLRMAWAAVRHVKSNAIVFAQGGATVGVGAGQMNRVDSVRLAAWRAGERSQGAAMGSDAFFPFPDGIEAAAEAGVTAVIQPGGSIRDAKVIDAVNKLNLAMVFTGQRHFQH